MINQKPQRKCHCTLLKFSQNLGIAQNNEYISDAGVCDGDSGSSLVYTEGDRHNSNSKKYLIGVNSLGPAFCEKRHPAIITRVSEYLYWIKKGMVGEQPALCQHEPAQGTAEAALVGSWKLNLLFIILAVVLQSEIKTATAIKRSLVRAKCVCVALGPDSKKSLRQISRTMTKIQTECNSKNLRQVLK